MTEHRMQLAKVSSRIARRKGWNTNHHVRVWCSCMDHPSNAPGTFAGQHRAVKNDRTPDQAAVDPRRLGSYDHLGVADMRIPGSALALFREHVERSEKDA